jgi:hypothetical protein
MSAMHIIRRSAVMATLLAGESFGSPSSVFLDGLTPVTASDSAFAIGDFAFRFVLGDEAVDAGFFSISNNGASSLGTGADLYLIAMGQLDETDGLLVTSTAGRFSLAGIALAKGVAGRGEVTIQGLANDVVIAEMQVALADAAPQANPGNGIGFTAVEWAYVDSFRIVNTDSSTDFDVEIDDIVVSPSPPPLVPQMPRITDVTAGDGEVRLQVGVAFDGGSPITAFTATCTGGGSRVVASSAITAIDVTGVTNGVPYVCTVVASNSAGSSDSSDPSAAVLPTAAAASALPPWLLYEVTRGAQRKQ